MIPLSDSQRRKSFPWATSLLLAALVAVFVREFSLGRGIVPFVDRFAFHPADLFAMRAGAPATWWVLATLVTSLFLHAGLLHLFGNAAFLAVFGDDVEGRMGSWRFLALFAASGVCAALAQSLATPRSHAPLVGASGAIAGVLGVFLVLFPTARISGVLPIGCLLLPARSPAFLFLPLWFLLQLASALVEPIGRGGGAGVAWYAHLGGFAIGPLLYLLLRRR